jgi:hypothetical protein
MRKYLTIHEEAVSHIWLCTRSLISLHMRKISFSFLSVQCLLFRILNFWTEIAASTFSDLFLIFSDRWALLYFANSLKELIPCCCICTKNTLPRQKKIITLFLALEQNRLNSHAPSSGSIRQSSISLTERRKTKRGEREIL